jgi:hypothetical protein
LRSLYSSRQTLLAFITSLVGFPTEHRCPFLRKNIQKKVLGMGLIG